ncbi:2-amino-4-hydroxy-6-hydroxymethyldihydropteridine diphosphokinase [Gaoshiqia sp. Z1-71]|uniref:2-amino-4-hydroxy-6- hydroxymethyldihydropteridine diphosphokinase n=1 Tax=Gaoshiqia hydrogeniformans TaxID=3290090 RepID=UPI003BF794AC
MDGKIKHTAIVGIGSNIEPDKHISRMLTILKQETTVLDISRLMKTKPIGIADQPWFVNGAVKLETDLPIADFRQYLKQVEDRLGRDRSQAKFGPRCIDLDLVVWDGQVVDDDYYTRDFLKQAAAELGFSEE